MDKVGDNYRDKLSGQCNVQLYPLFIFIYLLAKMYERARVENEKCSRTIFMNKNF